ncbi:hypothetical protein B0A48_11288 [Cryoendolithus antarcticus]|uniref:Extracellular membrane protein CFEM domain-containing protein n=1 Tax=Cryoendolithus antarcticus TaxID=1507870 RepID=A0A1V8SVC4_9PEZI|nr:hypothetical protein B0A48_11288 [Cryoendolithus antarcticus]
MHLSTASLLLTSLTLATAQTSTSTSTSTSQPPSHTGTITPSGCGPEIDGMIQTCVINSNNNLIACDKTDLACLCDKATAVADCYLNCPTAPRQDNLIDAKDAWCAHAAEAAATVTRVEESVVTTVIWPITGKGFTSVTYDVTSLKAGDALATASSEAGAGKVGAGVVSGGGVVGLLLGWVALL